MSSIKEILESAGLPAQRGVYTGRCKPKAYYTFLRLNGGAAVNADDTESESKEMYRVTLFHKGDYEAQLKKTLEVLRAADFYINSVDMESYETETGYWLVQRFFDTHILSRLFLTSIFPVKCFGC